MKNSSSNKISSRYKAQILNNATFISNIFLDNIQNCNFASCAVWVRNLVSHFEAGAQTEGF